MFLAEVLPAKCCSRKAVVELFPRTKTKSARPKPIRKRKLIRHELKRRNPPKPLLGGGGAGRGEAGNANGGESLIAIAPETGALTTEHFGE